MTKEEAQQLTDKLINIMKDNNLNFADTLRCLLMGAMKATNIFIDDCSPKKEEIQIASNLMFEQTKDLTPQLQFLTWLSLLNGTISSLLDKCYEAEEENLH